jgi:hypothetical protein
MIRGLSSGDTRLRIGLQELRQERKMRRNISIAILGLVLLFGGGVNSVAQVKRVQMHIGGYLCGN